MTSRSRIRRRPWQADSITVVLGCFDPVVRLGLAHLLDSDEGIRLIGVDLSGIALERAFGREAPMVAILNEESVAELSVPARLKSIQPATSIIVLAHRPTPAYCMRLFAAQASCLAKDAPVEQILATVRLVANGRHSAGLDALTPREMEVFRCIRAGKSNPEIARALQVGDETVKTHATRIRRKLGVKSKHELIAMPVPDQFVRETPARMRVTTMA